MPSNILAIVVAAPILKHGDGRVSASKKLMTGLAQYSEHWMGRVCVFAPPGLDAVNLDVRDWAQEELPFDVVTLPLGSTELRVALTETAVVMSGQHHELQGLAQFCRSHSVPYVLNCEYSLKTRLQIVRAEVENPLRRMRRYAWELAQELKCLKQARQATAIQCNGTPTYESYGAVARNALLYFDSRIEPHMLADAEGVHTRLQRNAPGPLRLVYSGRLAEMKGADYLPKVAAELRARGLEFTLDIFGAGPLREALEAEIQASGLADCVRLRGNADFEHELLPYIRSNSDLFVCCHPQGDPACTYLETFACGVPIAGFANDALVGLLGHVDAGQTVPMGDIPALATVIEGLARHREQLAAFSFNALDFAEHHTFPAVIEERVRHLASLTGKPLYRRGAQGLNAAPAMG